MENSKKEIEKNGKMKPWQCLSGSQLKWIALFSMIIDHTAMVLISRSAYPIMYTFMRSIGRLAFPIYCFLLVEGFYHTHCFWKYAVSLGIFAILSEIPYNLVKGNLFFPSRQNVFFTLFLGLLMIKLMQKKKDAPIFCFLFFMAFSGIAQFFSVDYGMFGIMQIAGIYFCYQERLARHIVVVFLNFLQGSLQVFGAAAVIPMECYNGARGKQWKYFFYAIYPIHLLLLFFIRFKFGVFGDEITVYK